MPSTRINRQETFAAPPSPWWAMVLIVIQLGLIAFAWWRLPPQIPLYYSLPYGFARLAPKLLILMLPGLSLATWLAYLLFFKFRVRLAIYGHIQYWMMQLVLFLLTIAVAHTILIVL
jgi:hypothetical protein